jgi:predicted nucleotidyltransferase
MLDYATHNDLELIKDAITRELGSVEAIYLFGSVARGNYHKESDYDVVVFVKKFPNNKLKSISRIRNDVSDNINRPVELFILELEDLKYPSPFLYEVYNNHHLLYGNDVIKQCKEIIKDIKPFFVNGIKIGYHV